ncbi:ECF transporter S component [Corynebacterium sp. 153RC1]|uniref:ECF transporter S component n=1 Tax=Corynebacterium TaxID=1716 RepID=UPI00211CFAE3|nr:MULTISPECIES: ECF transporter S component [unclassified Corynebacterium]MCQ9370382.1 ECF transporter S component [Corynebacterium sp. 35RC1]MCQ9343318.1 ECF transporter S component [Corynebacterium sp. 76QC2CO]MCQ9351942.1 ECF transporter S component [Corynebacterium sp. 209RC1]MCQ9353691.1 ECF transporter S component [Corynebacterium sp. 1222RC1]MCQ9356325.1 ECF transporter S component [Corynebacterium sp. 122RC1]
MQRWRVIDILIASVLGIACGLLFWIWNSIGYAWYTAADALTPGFGGIATGIWLIGGPIGALVIRKPGAAIYVEVLAAAVSAAIGNQWGIETLYSGLAQGIGAEILFLIFAYRRFGLVVAALSGVGAAVGAFLLELVTSANYAKSLAFNLTYLSTMAISGIILAGGLAYFLVKALAATGALDRFAAGREARELV